MVLPNTPCTARAEAALPKVRNKAETPGQAESLDFLNGWLQASSERTTIRAHC
jgi:hypothetical protein